MSDKAQSFATNGSTPRQLLEAFIVEHLTAVQIAGNQNQINRLVDALFPVSETVPSAEQLQLAAEIDSGALVLVRRWFETDCYLDAEACKKVAQALGSKTAGRIAPPSAIAPNATDAKDAARYRSIREQGIPCIQADECGSCSGAELDSQIDMQIGDALANPEKYDV